MGINIDLNFNKIKKITSWLLDHIISISIMTSVLIVVLFGIFLYFNFYQTIISAKKIIVLQSDVSPAKINTTLLDKIETTYQNKLNHQQYDWSKFSQYFSSNFSDSEPTNSKNSNPAPRTSF